MTLLELREKCKLTQKEASEVAHTSLRTYCSYEKDEDVADVINDLQVSNYCYTVEDRNLNFPNEFFWIFGITRVIVDSEEKLYIKLKIRKFKNVYLLVMSFHPEQTTSSEDALTFPYAS